MFNNCVPFLVLILVYYVHTKAMRQTESTANTIAKEGE